MNLEAGAGVSDSIDRGAFMVLLGGIESSNDTPWKAIKAEWRVELRCCAW